MAKERYLAMKELKSLKYSTIIAENYYEIIKELMTAILLSKGIKTIGENAHKELITEISKEKILSAEENYLIDDLRKRRNNSYYSGEPINKIFLENHSHQLEEIIKKLFRYPENSE